MSIVKDILFSDRKSFFKAGDCDPKLTALLNFNSLYGSKWSDMFTFSFIKQ